MTLPSFDELRDTLVSRLGPASAEHCLRVAAAAERIAEAYGVDRETARTAGLLHDWSRDLSDEDLLAEADRHSLPIDPVDVARPYLLHARAAAADLRESRPGIPEDVLGAVEAHTLGAEAPSDVDKVVYVADMVEPARSFRGADDLRAAVGEVTLDELYAMACATTLVHLVESRRLIHPQTVRSWNAIVGGEGR